MPHPRMTSTEAAKRLRRMESGESAIDVYQCGHVPLPGGGRMIAIDGLEAAMNDERSVKRWALPLLDDTPIDQDWVLHTFRLTVNGAELNDRLYLKRSRKGWGVYAVAENNEYGEAMEEFLVAPITTRGQLRLLALALGIELKGGE